jgi:hypothetical protein
MQGVNGVNQVMHGTNPACMGNECLKEQKKDIYLISFLLLQIDVAADRT